MNSPVSNRIARIILALGFVLALAACSTVKLGYMNLPHLAYWWLDGHADFSDEQEPRVRDALASLHAWHRASELPRVVELIARMEQMAPGDISPQQACTVAQQVQARIMALARQAEPDAVALAATLRPPQLRHLARKFRSDNERFRREWIAPAPEEQLARRYEKTLERFESIYGTFDAPQRAVLRQRLAAARWEPDRILERRQLRQQELLHVLTRISQGLPAPEGGALLRGWFERLERPADAAARAEQDALLQQACATFAAVHQATTAPQRDQAVRRLRAWQRDLRELSAQP